jgi:hypothetical protein
VRACDERLEHAQHGRRFVSGREDRLAAGHARTSAQFMPIRLAYFAGRSVVDAPRRQDYSQPNSEPSLTPAAPQGPQGERRVHCHIRMSRGSRGFKRSGGTLWARSSFVKNRQ